MQAKLVLITDSRVGLQIGTKLGTLKLDHDLERHDGSYFALLHECIRF